MSNLKEFLTIFVWGILLGLSACGGSSPGGGDTLPSKVLSWEPPSSYSDGTQLDPTRDLDSFEIYLKENGNFSDTDQEMASISATDAASGQVTSSFNLKNLAPFISNGIVYHVSVRAVAKTGLKSNFSPSATFSY